MVLSLVLAFFFGYLLTFRSVRRHGVTPREGARLALASDTLPITSMEIIDNRLISRGRGHAVVHELHGHASAHGAA